MKKSSLPLFSKTDANRGAYFHGIAGVPNRTNVIEDLKIVEVILERPVCQRGFHPPARNQTYSNLEAFWCYRAKIVRTSARFL